ncbi:hypothetical protein EV426DRAFT_213373 [Tirmania nivea]|nr:hypothetical protein EV426DRAFT_213373 [Tirmania nivea]
MPTLTREPISNKRMLEGLELGDTRFAYTQPHTCGASPEFSDITSTRYGFSRRVRGEGSNGIIDTTGSLEKSSIVPYSPQALPYTIPSETASLPSSHYVASPTPLHNRLIVYSAYSFVLFLSAEHRISLSTYLQLHCHSLTYIPIMLVEAFLSLGFLPLLGFIFITPSLAARDKEGHWIPLPPCGEFCYTLHSGKSSCSTWEAQLATSTENCYCHDDDFLHNFIDCVVNSDYCTNGQDVDRSLTYIIDDCEQSGGRLMPYKFEELYMWFSVEERVKKTSVAMPIEPTTYTWTFSGMNSYLEVIPTVSPCGPKPTPSIARKSTRGGAISSNTITTYPTASAEAIQVIITEAVMVTVTFQTTAAQPPLLDASSLFGKIKVPETMEFCPTNITITHTKPLVTTIYSSMDYTIITEDTRSDRPTSPYTFWDSTFTTNPTETVTTETKISSEGSKLSGERSVLFAVMGMFVSMIFS